MKRLIIGLTLLASPAYAGELHCGNDVARKETMDTWNEHMANIPGGPKILDIYDDKLSTRPGRANIGEIKLNCTAMATLSVGDDVEIHYVVSVLRGKWYSWVIPTSSEEAGR